MSERNFFNQRNTIPGLLFIIIILVYSLPEIMILIIKNELPKMDAITGLFISTFTLLSGAPIGFFISQIWHIIWWFFYEIVMIRINIIPFKQFKSEFKFDSDPRGLHTLYNYFTGVEINEISKYTARRWDVINTIGPSIISVALGRYFSLTYLKEEIIKNYNLTHHNSFNKTVEYVKNTSYLKSLDIIIFFIVFISIFGIIRLLYHNYNMVIFYLRQINTGLPNKEISTLNDVVPKHYFKRGKDLTSCKSSQERENQETTCDHRSNNAQPAHASKKELEHQLFFGLVYSLALLFITYPQISDLSNLFKEFVDLKVAIYVSQLSKVILISCLLLSGIFRYYGAVKENLKYIVGSLHCFLIGFHLTINIIIYKIFWLWLSSIYFPFTTLLPTILLIINIFIINKYEKKWYMYYSDNIPKVIASDFSIIFNGWIFGCLVLSVLIQIFIPLTQIVIYIIIGLSAILSPKIVLHFRKKFPYSAYA